LIEYNDLDSLKAGTKLILPSKKDEWYSFSFKKIWFSY
jgi:hypothetical protein